MNLPPAIAVALAGASQALTSARVPHAVGGSVLLHAMGVEIVPGDVDILASVHCRRAVSDALTWRRLGGPKPSEFVRSTWIDRYQAPGAVVEVIGDMTVQVGEHRLLVPIGGEESISVNSVDVPLGDPAAWLAVYRVIRPERAEALAAVLRDAGTAPADHRVG